MTAVRYAPGDLRVAVADEGVVVLAADAPEALVPAAWEHLRAGAGIVGVIDALAADRPLSSLPGFAIVVPEGDGWRVAVRGAFSVTLADGARIDTTTGAPWIERAVPDDVALTITAAPGTDTEAALPLLDGVALAAVVVVTRSPGASSSRPTRVAAPVEPVQPHTVAEVHDAPAAPPAPAAPSPATTVPSPAPPTPPAAAPTPPAAPPAPAPPAAPSITDSIPEHLRPVPAAPVSPPPVPPLPASGGLGDDEDTLLRGDAAPPLPDDVDETVIRSRPDAAPEVVGDHDGETLSLEEARRLRAAGALPPAAPSAAPAPPPAAVGRAVLSTGQVVALDRILVVGRRPRSTRAAGTVPHLVAVDSPQQDISRNHLELRPEGDSILATDLDTTNGTTLLRAGSAPVKLHPSEPTIVVTGDVLDLGEGITVTVEAPE